MSDVPRYYWDACAWIGLIQQESGRFDSLSFVIEEAKAGRVEIWTSNFTLAEVFKRPCDGENKGLATAEDVSFEDYVLQDFVTRAQVDLDVGTFARRLLRAYPEIKKPQDAIHLATALLNNIDELHTYDRNDLLDLSEKIERKDGTKLKICHPPKPPPPAKVEKTPLEEAIDAAKADDDEGKASGTGSGRP